jgi:RNA polymerase sigma-70 factor (ECF subfamily)
MWAQERCVARQVAWTRRESDGSEPDTVHVTPYMEELLRQEHFVRAVARQLLAGEHDAEDAAQQAMLRGIERPPAEPGSLRSYLGRIVRNTVFDARRQAQERERRERAAAQGEAVPSAAEMVEREQVRRLVCEAVLALAEPYRGTVWLRFYEDLPPREVARRMGVPVNTVRTRVQRAVEQLRRSLDRSHGGSRSAWRGLLAPLVGVEAQSVVSGGGIAGVLVMKKSLAMAVVFATVCALLLLPLPGSSPDAARDVPGEVLGREAAAQGIPAGAPRAEPASRVAARQPVAIESRRAAARAAAPSGSLLVRVVWASDGMPAPGVNVNLNVPEAGTGSRLFPVEGVTGADGTVRFPVVAAGIATVFVDRGGWEKAVVEAGEETAVKVRVKQGVGVAGVVVDAAGAPVAGAEISLMEVDSGVGKVVARSDHAGKFAARDLGPGQCIVARAAGHAPSRPQMVAPNAGPRELLFVLPGPGGGIEGRARDPAGRPVGGALVFAGDPHVFASDRTDQRSSGLARGLSGPDGSFRLDGLRLGANEVFVRARGFATWRAPVEVQAGTRSRIEARLGPGATLTGSVRTSDGQPVPGFHITVLPWDRILGSAAHGEQDGTFRVDRVTPGEIDVVLGWGSARTKLVATEGQEVRWDHVFPPPSKLAIRGRLVDETGAPLPDWSMVVQSEDPEAGGSDERRATTGADGEFTVENLTEGGYRVAAHQKGSRFASLQIDGVRPGGDALLVRMPDHRRPSVRIVGSVADADGRPFAGATVSVQDALLSGGDLATVKEDTGRFELGPYPPGEWTLCVQPSWPGGLVSAFPPTQPQTWLGPKRLAANVTWDVGTVRLLPAGALAVTVEREPAVPEDSEVSLQVFAGSRLVRCEFTRAGDVWTSTPLSPGDYWLCVSGRAVASDRVPVEVPAAKQTRVPVRLRPGRPVVVRVLEGTPESGLRNAMLVVQDADGRIVHERLLAWRAGEPFEAALALGAGSWSLVVTTTTGERAEGRIDVHDLRSPPETLVLTLR